MNEREKLGGARKKQERAIDYALWGVERSDPNFCQRQKLGPKIRIGGIRNNLKLKVKFPQNINNEEFYFRGNFR